jgi:hypothetical protein
MDTYIQNIKMSTGLISSPEKHTEHKTIRAPCVRHGQKLYRAYNPPPDQHPALCGLLNIYLMAVDFTNYRETDRLFLFITIYLLSVWQCYIVKYP